MLRVWRANTGRLQFKRNDCHASEIAAVGLFKNVIISGGRDRAVKVRPLYLLRLIVIVNNLANSFRFGSTAAGICVLYMKSTLKTGYYLWILTRLEGFSAQVRQVIGAWHLLTYLIWRRNNSSTSFQKHDTSQFTFYSGALLCPLRKEFRDGEGVYDVHFESPNEVLTADFNSALRLWDVR